MECGDPPVVKYARLEFNETVYDAAAKYRCKIGYDLYGGSPDGQVRCESDGRWAPLPECIGQSPR